MDIECSPVEIRLRVRTTQPYLGRIYPKGLGKSPCEKIYDTNLTTGLNESVTLYTVPLLTCNTVLHDITVRKLRGHSDGKNQKIVRKCPFKTANRQLNDFRFQSGLEYQNSIVIQVHRSLVTSNDRVYNVRCRYESINTTITASLNLR